MGWQTFPISPKARWINMNWENQSLIRTWPSLLFRAQWPVKWYNSFKSGLHTCRIYNSSSDPMCTLWYNYLTGTSHMDTQRWPQVRSAPVGILDWPFVCTVLIKSSSSKTPSVFCDQLSVPSCHVHTTVLQKETLVGCSAVFRPECLSWLLCFPSGHSFSAFCHVMGFMLTQYCSWAYFVGLSLQLLREPDLLECSPILELLDAG